MSLPQLAIFKRTQFILERISTLLEKELNALTIKGNGIQPRERINKGEIFYKGLFLPLTAVEHKLLFENYEIVALRGFLELFVGISKNIDNVFTEFAVRTISEIGNDHIAILFNQNVAPEDRKRFSLIIMLSDFAFMENAETTSYLKQFKLLLKENKILLSEKQQLVFEDISKNIQKADKNLKVKLVKDARALILKEKNRILQKLGNKDSQKSPIHFEALASSFSHLLHGNSFIIKNLFSTHKNPYQHLFRMYSVLMILGINVANEVNQSLKSDSIQNEIQQIQIEFEMVRNELLNTWTITDKATNQR